MRRLIRKPRVERRTRFTFVSEPEPAGFGDLMRCQYCNYEWSPRVKRPKQCPRCKRYL